MSADSRDITVHLRTADRQSRRLGAEHYIEVVRAAALQQLASGRDPSQTMIDASMQLEAWLMAHGEPGFEPPNVLVERLDRLLDELATKLTSGDLLAWLRTPTDRLDGQTPIEAIVGHRMHAVLALAPDLPDLRPQPERDEAGWEEPEAKLDDVERRVLDVLWVFAEVAPVDAERIRDELSERERSGSTIDIESAMARLVAAGYASRMDLRSGEPPTERATYVPLRRYSERIPAICKRSPLAQWLWDVRAQWSMWTLRPGERSVWVDNWGQGATAEEWSWLASRPALVADGQPTPEDPAWWTDASPNAAGDGDDDHAA